MIYQKVGFIYTYLLKCNNLNISVILAREIETFISRRDSTRRESRLDLVLLRINVTDNYVFQHNLFPFVQFILDKF